MLNCNMFHERPVNTAKEIVATIQNNGEIIIGVSLLSEIAFSF